MNKMASSSPLPLHQNHLSSLGLKLLYPPGSALSLIDLTAPEIRQLAHHLAPENKSLCTSTSEPHQLPQALRRTNILPQHSTIRTLHTLGAGDALPSAAPLCRKHRHLNAQVIASVLAAIEGEVEDFLPEVLARIGNQDGVGLADLQELQMNGGPIGEVDGELVRAGYEHLSPLALHHVQAAEDIMALVMEEDEFYHFYRRAPLLTKTSKTPWADSCGACRIRAIASMPSALIGLRGILLARLPADILDGWRTSPRLEFVEALMKSFGHADATHMLQVSGRIGWEMRTLVESRSSRTPATSYRRQANQPPRRPSRPAHGLYSPGLTTMPMTPPPPQVKYHTKPVFEWHRASSIRHSCIPPPLVLVR